MMVREGYDWLAYCKSRRVDNPIHKTDLIEGQYYVGKCRNASIARWFGDEQVFKHWRTKFGSTFIEWIKHPEDEDSFDVFIPIRVATAEDLSQLLPRPIDNGT